MALRQQRYVCDRCGYRWEQLIWDGGRPETQCLFCRQSTATPVFGDALDATPGPDGLTWSDEWRGQSSPMLQLVVEPRGLARRRLAYQNRPPALVRITSPGPNDQAGPVMPHDDTPPPGDENGEIR